MSDYSHCVVPSCTVIPTVAISAHYYIHPDQGGWTQETIVACENDGHILVAQAAAWGHEPYPFEVTTSMGPNWLMDANRLARRIVTGTWTDIYAPYNLQERTQAVLELLRNEISPVPDEAVFVPATEDQLRQLVLWARRGGHTADVTDHRRRRR